MLASFAHQTVTRVRPAWVTERGSQKADYVHPASLLVIDGCVVEPVPSQDARGDREATMFEQHLMLPPGSDLKATDLVLLGAVKLADYATFTGTKYGVHGEPEDADSPSGNLAYMECRIRVWVNA